MNTPTRLRLAVLLAAGFASVSAVSAQGERRGRTTEFRKPPASTPSQSPQAEPERPGFKVNVPGAPIETAPLPPLDSTVAAPELRSEPIVIASLGLSLFLPEGSVVGTNSMAGGETKVAIKGPNSEWLLQVFSSASSDKGLTPARVLDTVIRQRAEGVPRALPQHKLIVMGRDDKLMLAGMSASRAYIDTPTIPNAVVTGYTMLSTGPGRFVILQIDMPRANFPTARLTYETIIAATQFRDPAEMSAERKMLVETGEGFLRMLTAEDLDAALDADGPTVLRSYIPAATGAPGDATEVGFQIVSVRKGQLGEVSPTKRRENWSTAEREFGYVVQIDARQLLRDSPGDPATGEGVRLFKSQAIFFLSRDRASETWSIVNEIKQGKQRDRFVQTVVRAGDKLTSKSEGRTPEPEIGEWSLPETGYISRVELQLLPRLLVARNMTGLFGFYHYDLFTGRLTLRRDEFKTAPGGFERIARSSEDAAADTITYDAQGREVRRISPLNGIVTEPITIERLRKIWTDKGIPMD